MIDLFGWRGSAHLLAAAVFFQAIVVGAEGCDSLRSEKCVCQDPPPMEPGQTEFSETELRCAVYTDYRSPEGFYWEDLSLPGREGSASICYENTVSIDSTNEWVEMCTGRLSQARVWSETSARSSAYYRRLLDTTSTKRYLQFRRVYDKNPRDVLLSRVHKCSYFDPSEPFHYAGSSIKRDARGDSTPTDSISIGTFGPRPITPARVRRLAEYFSFIGQYNTGGAWR